jgi:hypothetical protein
MKIRFILLATVAGALATGGAQAATKHKHHPAANSANTQLLEEVKALRAEVESLRAKVDTNSSVTAATAAQVSTTQSQVAATQAEVQAVQTQVAATPAVTKEQVGSQIAAAVDKEHHNDKFYFKGITITPGGFLEAAGIYRSRFQGDDIASSFAIPFPGQSHPSHVSEGRFSARQSRVSFLAEGMANPDTKLSMYTELDFQGAAQTSNSNQSNSYVPRIRNVYGTIDWNQGLYGIHFLAGQNWSLLTMQGKGMSPRSEVTPPQIDAQYVPGFAWARQPGVRLTADFMEHKLWVGLAAENAQTTFGGTGVPAGVVSVINGQGYSSLGVTCPAVVAPATTATCTVTNNTQAVPSGSFQQFYNGVGSTLSLNTVPDFIGKVAYESAIAGHNVHLEAFGIYRTFSTHLDGTDIGHDQHGFGYGGSINLQVVPKVLDAQFSGFGGRGIGRYGSAGLPDVTSDAAGNIHPIDEMMLLAGVTLHATPKLDIYGFGGEEREYQKLLDGGATGLGLATANNTGCFIETATTATSSTCAGNTKAIRQITAGFWDKFYQGSFGRAQVGLQYSYTDRQLFDGVGGDPRTHNSMVFLSFRYYPF